MTDTILLDWLEKHPQCEVSYYNADDEPRWCVHQIIGGRNDREWKLIAEADTVREAIRLAMGVLK